MGRGPRRPPRERKAWAWPTPASGSVPSTAARPVCVWRPVPRVAPLRRCGFRTVAPERRVAVAEIRALIVDDEPLARRGVRQLLAAYPDIIVVGECRDGREALRALATLLPELVFLDIQMPGLDGLGVIRAHGVERMPPVIFVTAHDEFAVRAFEAEALDYLVKPL